MELVKFIMWLTAGAVVGWFANKIISIRPRWASRPVRTSDDKKR